LFVYFFKTVQAKALLCMDARRAGQQFSGPRQYFLNPFKGIKMPSFPSVYAMPANVINFPAVSSPAVNPLPALDKLNFTVQNAPADFEPVKGAGHVSSKYFINFRTDIEADLGICKGRYEIINNSRLYDIAGKALAEHAPARALSGARLEEKISDNGAQSFFDLSFPALTEDVQQMRGRSTGLIFRILGWNSFDGSSPVKFSTGAIDGFCTNGMIWGEYDLFGRRHTAGFNEADLSKFFAAAFSSFQEKIRLLRIEAQKPLDITAAEKFLKSKFSERRAAQLLERFAIESQERGASLWALRSALTFYASHNSSQFGVRQTGLDNEARTLYQREDEVRRVVESGGWRELLAA
jgi:hypothetical protein